MAERRRGTVNYPRNEDIRFIEPSSDDPGGTWAGLTVEQRAKYGRRPAPTADELMELQHMFRTVIDPMREQTNNEMARDTARESMTAYHTGTSGPPLPPVAPLGTRSPEPSPSDGQSAMDFLYALFGANPRRQRTAGR